MVRMQIKVAVVAAVAAAAVSQPSPPIAPVCAAQLEKDGCLPTMGTHKCADCGEAHKQDLEKAKCTEKIVLSWCEGKGALLQLAPAVVTGCRFDIVLAVAPQCRRLLPRGVAVQWVLRNRSVIIRAL